MFHWMQQNLHSISFIKLGEMIITLHGSYDFSCMHFIPLPCFIYKIKTYRHMWVVEMGHSPLPLCLLRLSQPHCHAGRIGGSIGGSIVSIGCIPFSDVGQRNSVFSDTTRFSGRSPWQDCWSEGLWEDLRTQWRGGWTWSCMGVMRLPYCRIEVAHNKTFTFDKYDNTSELFRQ